MSQSKATHRKPKNHLGALIIAVVLVVDAGLALLVWQRWQAGKEEAEAAAPSERPLVEVAVPDDPAIMDPAALASPYAIERAKLAPPPERAEPDRRRVPLEARARSPLPSASGAASAPRRGAPAARLASPALEADVRGHLPAATEHYRRLKQQGRYRALSQAWTEEFVKHPELRALNHRYHQDRDALAFILGAVRSKEFMLLLGRYAARPDVQGFMKDMAASPHVGASMRGAIQDPAVAKALTTIPLPGLPATPRR